MGKGKETQAAVLLSHIEVFIDGMELVKEIGMGQHDPFGFSRGSRGVDNGDQVVGVTGLEVGFDLGIVVCCVALGQEVGQGDHFVISLRIQSIKGDDEFQGAIGPGQQGEGMVQLFLVADKEQAQTGIVDDVLGLLCRVGGIDGHRDGKGHENAQVGYGPLGTVAREYAHPIVADDAPGHECLGQGT